MTTLPPSQQADHHPMCSKLRRAPECGCWQRACEEQLAENERLRDLVDGIYGTALGGVDFPREALERIAHMAASQDGYERGVRDAARWLRNAADQSADDYAKTLLNGNANGLRAALIETDEKEAQRVMLMTVCVSCRHGDHAGCQKGQKPPKGVMGGWECSCPCRDGADAAAKTGAHQTDEERSR